MSLQVRRGTNAERLTITPRVGELIYVTDHITENVAPIWVGDGVTVGGNPAISEVQGDLADLNDIDVSLAGDGDVLSYNQSLGVWEAVPLTASGTGIVEGSNYRINIAADDSTIMVDTSTGTLNGNLVGNVIGQNLNIIIDALNNYVHTDRIINTNNNLVFYPALAGTNQVRITNIDDRNSVEFQREDTTVQPGNTRIGQFKFSWEDNVTAKVDAALWGVNKDSMFFLIDDVGAFTQESGFNYDIGSGAGRFGINKFDPQATLHVNGNAIISGGLDADITGSLYSDTSVVLIDGTDGKLMVANINMVGETGNTPVDTGTVDSWLEVTVNGATKYIPLYS